MAYGNDPANDTADELRFLIGDVNDPPILSDDEIDYLLTTSTSTRDAARIAALRIATKFGALADKTVGDLSISYQSRADRFTALSTSLGSASAPIPAGTYPRAEGDLEHIFEIGQHDHPENKFKKTIIQT